jgi:DNA-directed RNA polymerase specialized sigma24 family protein
VRKKNDFSKENTMHTRYNPPLSVHVEMMLDIWAKWARRGRSNGLNYSHLSNIGWIIENGGVPIERGGQKAKCPLEDDPIAEEMEKWITELAHEKPMEADALVQFYVTGWYKEKLARLMGVSVRTIEARMKTAKTWLEGRYSAKKKML